MASRSRRWRVAEAAGQGELAAAFIANRPMLLRLLTARLGSPAEAEDALQEMWLRVDRLGAAPIEQPGSFLFRMAANLATDLRIAASRRGARDTGWLDVQPGAAEFADPERAALGRDELARAQAVIAAMPERMRTALTMFRLEEESQRTIATTLGITISGVEKLLRRAYAQLHAAAGADRPKP